MTALHELLEVVRCPVGRSPLSVMEEPELREFNVAIAERRVRYGTGAPVDEPLEGGLATPDRTSLYRIRGGVPHLLPRLRIAPPEETPSGPALDPPRAGELKHLQDVWEVLSQRWGRVQPPLRPALPDVELFQRAAGDALSGPGPRRALLLGVTPEIATMARPGRTALLALDSSPAMVRNVWPGREVDGAAVALADWKAMPVGDAAFGFVIGDGVLTSQRYPGDFTALASEIRRVIADRGTLVIRLFARPERPDPPEAVFADLQAGRIGSFDVFHWRLQMSLHRSLEEGTRLADVWNAWQEAVPDPPALMSTLGWAPDAARVLETYRDLETRISFPTVSEVREILTPQFELRACRVPEYEMGERYPTVVFGPRPA